MPSVVRQKEIPELYKQWWNRHLVRKTSHKESTSVSPSDRPRATPNSTEYPPENSWVDLQPSRGNLRPTHKYGVQGSTCHVAQAQPSAPATCSTQYYRKKPQGFWIIHIIELSARQIDGAGRDTSPLCWNDPHVAVLDWQKCPIRSPSRILFIKIKKNKRIGHRLFSST